jgi:hypothetical protein
MRIRRPGRGGKLSRLTGSFIWLSFFLSGCSVIPTPETTRPPRVLSAQEVLFSLRQRNDQLNSLRAITHLTLATPEEQRSFRASLLVQKPCFIRLEVLNMFMQPVQFFVLNEHDLMWYIPADKKVLRGAPTSLNIYRLLGIRVSATELVSILLGGVPLPSSRDIKPRLSYQEAEGSYRLQFCPETDRCFHQIWLDSHRLYGIKLIHTPEPTREWQINWENFERLQGYYLPTLIKLERLDQSCWLELKYSQPAINLPLSRDKFWLELPPGVETVLLGG